MARHLGGTTAQSFQDAIKRIKVAGGKLTRRHVPGAVLMIGHEIMTDVKASRPGAGVPRDKGTLANTGDVTKVGLLEVDLSFGGPAAPYALIQHEVTTYHHKLGESRYLVRGIERWRPGGSAAMQALKENAAAALKGH